MATQPSRKREPQIYFAHHHYPKPEDVRHEDVMRLGRLIHEILHRAARPVDSPGDRQAEAVVKEPSR